MPKIYAMLVGRDLNDASVTHLVLPEGIDIDAEHKSYENWYREVYAPAVKVAKDRKSVV